MNRSALAAMALMTAIVLALGISCSQPHEAPRVELPIVVDASGIVPVTTDLGYVVEVNDLRIAFRDITFTIAGEIHARTLFPGISDFFVRSAYAHPGHHHGGEVTGELPGRFVVDWFDEDGQTLGIATFITGKYTSANFTFDHVDFPEIADNEPSMMQTAVLSGTASKSNRQVSFSIVVNSPLERELVGAPFDAVVTEGSVGKIQFRFDTRDPFEHDTLFDDIDFFSLTPDDDGVVRLNPANVDNAQAYYRFRRAFQTHDHYFFHLKE